MNKSKLVLTLAAACGMGIASAAAVAQQATNVQATSQPAAIATQPAAANKAEAQHAVPPVDSRMCVRATGSHIPPPKGQCLAVNGSSYTRQDIDRTGAANLGQALRMLSPAVQVSGH